MATADTARYGDLCRLCATKTNMVLGINIFENEGAVRQIYKKIETCLPVQIHEGDELPKMICESCLYKLELLSEFRERTLRTENLLIDLFKELNAMQLQVDHQQMKIDVAQLEHADLVMAQHGSVLLDDHHLHGVNDLELGHLMHREIVEHEIILSHTNMPLDNIELSGHVLGQDLSNHSLQAQENALVGSHLQGGRYTDDMEYHEEHQMLAEQYSLNDINLSDSGLQTQESIKNAHSVIEDHAGHSEPQDINETKDLHVMHMNSLKQEDSNSESRLLIDENEEHFIVAPDDACNLSTPVDDIGSLITRSDKEWLYCNVCGKTYEDKKLFQEHYDGHFHKCSRCLAVFTGEEALAVHEKNAHESSSNKIKPVAVIVKKSSNSDNENSDECEASPDVDEDCDDLQDKEDPKKQKCSPKECKECGKVYKTNYKLTEHMRKHTGEQPFKCRSCDKAFRSKIGLAQHEAKHTGQYDYSCVTCGKGFQCKSYLMVHQRVHSDVKPYPCTTCGRNFKTKQSLLDHTNRHLGVKPYTCEICGRSFITNGLCKAHQKVHSGADNRKYSCKVCTKMFVSKSYLQTHLRIHTGEKPFMCEVCGKGFLTRVDLKIHSTMHTGEKSYVCEMCGKAFARRDALRCHRRSHTGERPYSCDICGQTFTQFSPMAIHKRLHTGERPYRCEVCGKTFVSKSTMMVHSKKHDQ